jgi:hypothetical protein
MTVFTPQTYSRNRCAECGTVIQAHDERRLCPTLYRPDTLESARAELVAAQRSGDEARIFVARGNVQRLQGRR